MTSKTAEDFAMKLAARQLVVQLLLFCLHLQILHGALNIVACSTSSGLCSAALATAKVCQSWPASPGHLCTFASLMNIKASLQIHGVGAELWVVV
jgi:hypothetical protein